MLSSLQESPVPDFLLKLGDEEDLFTNFSAQYFCGILSPAVASKNAISFKPKDLGDSTLSEHDGDTEKLVPVADKFADFLRLFTAKQRQMLGLRDNEELLSPKLEITKVEESGGVMSFETSEKEVNTVLTQWFTILRSKVDKRRDKGKSNSVLTTRVRCEIVKEDVTECSDLVDNRSNCFFNEDTAKFMQACRALLFYKPIPARCDLGTAMEVITQAVNFLVVDFLELVDRGEIPSSDLNPRELCLPTESVKRLKETYRLVKDVWKKGTPSPDFLEGGAQPRHLQHLLECATKAFLDIDHPARLSTTTISTSAVDAHLYKVKPVNFRSADIEEVRLIHFVLWGAWSLFPFARGSLYIIAFGRLRDNWLRATGHELTPKAYTSSPVRTGTMTMHPKGQNVSNAPLRYPHTES